MLQPDLGLFGPPQWRGWFLLNHRALRGAADSLLHIARTGIEFCYSNALGSAPNYQLWRHFLSLMFWTWLWGIPGALLSIPMLMILKIFCDHFKRLYFANPCSFNQ